MCSVVDLCDSQPPNSVAYLMVPTQGSRLRLHLTGQPMIANQLTLWHT